MTIEIIMGESSMTIDSQKFNVGSACAVTAGKIAELEARWYGAVGYHMRLNYQAQLANEAGLLPPIGPSYIISDDGHVEWYKRGQLVHIPPGRLLKLLPPSAKDIFTMYATLCPYKNVSWQKMQNIAKRINGHDFQDLGAFVTPVQKTRGFMRFLDFISIRKKQPLLTIIFGENYHLINQIDDEYDVVFRGNRDFRE